VPPDTVIEPLLNDTPTRPLVTVEQPTDGPATMVIAQALLLAPSASVTFTVNEPADVGVPVIAPLLVFKLSPAGRVPTME
jgi:hypothetical protein